MSVDAEKPEELLYANHAVIDIFGCRDLDDEISKSIDERISDNEDRFDHVVFRIIRKDGRAAYNQHYSIRGTG